MHVAILLAGVADPRKPLPGPASGDWRDLPGAASVSYKLSPFDEAALEIALKIRDQGAASRVTAVVTDGSGDRALMRAIAALKPDRVKGLCPPPAQRGNPAWLARHAPALLREGDAWPDLILIGREHGDLDDGMMPAYLAESWRLPFVALALRVQARDGGGWTMLRSGSRQDESLDVPTPAMASISNDKSNRLRHPLMKNVALAKQFKFEHAAPDEAQPAPRATLAQAAPARTASRGTRACRMFTGPVEEQAAALAAWLRASTTAH
jgi:electron transfer flavoprotein beta subunit